MGAAGANSDDELRGAPADVEHEERRLGAGDRPLVEPTRRAEEREARLALARDHLQVASRKPVNLRREVGTVLRVSNRARRCDPDRSGAECPRPPAVAAEDVDGPSERPAIDP